jgi:hypothetical protein
MLMHNVCTEICTATTLLHLRSYTGCNTGSWQLCTCCSKDIPSYGMPHCIIVSV